MSQLIQIILIMIYLISLFLFTDSTTHVVSISGKVIHPLFIALFSITFGIIISIISLLFCGKKREVKKETVLQDPNEKH